MTTATRSTRVNHSSARSFFVRSRAFRRAAVRCTLCVMTSYIDVPAAEIAARLSAIAAEAAGAPCAVRLGDERHAFVNVGVDFPVRRRTREETRRLRERLWAALEGAGMVMAPNAIAPPARGDLRGQVQVRRAVVASSPPTTTGRASGA
jgi:hypothetical protein